MNIITTSSVATAATIPLAARSADQPYRATAILRAATLLRSPLESGRQISTSAFGAAMSSCFGGTDAEGFWIWKDAYEALEAAQVLFICKFGPAILSRWASPQAALATTGLDEGRIGLELADRLILRRSRVMNDYRVELIGFTDAMVPRLKVLGLVSEIISWKLRLFIPTGAQGSLILTMLLDRHSIVGVTNRTAAA